MKIVISFAMMWLLVCIELSGQEVRLQREYFNKKNLKSEFYTLKYNGKIKHGSYKSYWYGNIMKEIGQFYENLKDGEWVLYGNNGKVEEIQYFDKGTKIGIWQKFVESGQVIERYDQGQDIELEPYFNVSYSYPALAREYEIEGTVKVKFELDDNCDLKAIRVVKSLNKDCDQSAIEGTKRLLNLMKKYNSPSCDTLRNVIEVNYKLQ